MSGETQPVSQQMTLEEFRQIPEGPPYYEFEEGEIIPMPAPLCLRSKPVLTANIKKY